MGSEREPTNWPYTRLAYILVILVWIAYVLLTFFSPQQANPRFNLNGSIVSILRLSFMVPLLAIWLIALGGVITFKNYARLIRGSTEARAIDLIANGLLWTIAYLLLASLLGATIQYLTSSPYLPTAQTIRNHLPMLASFIGFWLIYAGSHRLRRMASFSTWTWFPMIVFILYTAFAAAFTYAFISSPATTNGNGITIYGQPREVILFTLVLPFLFAWFAGIFASINVAKYARHTKGVIYRQVFRDLVRGILVAVAFGILVQILTLGSRFITQLNLPGLLAVVYALLVLYGLGFWFIRRGARRLTQIEVIK